MQKARGFTLIELMIAVAIIGILAAIAVPNYNTYITKSRRAAAESFLMTLSNQEAQLLLDLRRYVSVANNADFPNTPTAASPGLNITVPDDISQFYNVSIVATNSATAAPTFVVTATPVGAQAAADTQCGSLSIDQAGTKTITGTGTVSSCW